MHSPQIWEENGGVSYSLNVADLAPGGGGAESVERVFFFSYFPPVKPRYVLWPGMSYSLKSTVTVFKIQTTSLLRQISEQFFQMFLNA